MRSLKFAVLFAAASFIFAPPAVAGVKDVIKTTVVRSADTVSYSKAGLIYKIGYTVSVEHVGGNNVNDVVFRGIAETLRRDGAASPKNASPLFIESDDVTCQSIGSSSISCSLGRFRAGDPVKQFAVYFSAPVNSQSLNASAMPTIEVAQFTGSTGYSEDRKDAGGVVNDTSAWTVANVSLGTPDPTSVQGAVSKSSGATVSTGPNDGVPSSDPGSYKFATKVTVPAGGPSTSAAIQLKPFTAADNTEFQLCDAGKNFKNCYESSQTIGTVFTAASGNYLTIILRVDTTELKSSFSIRKLKVYYTDNGGDYSQPLQYCVDQPLSDTPGSVVSHCIENIRRLGSSAATGLPGDVEVILRGLKNGRTTIY